MSDLARHFNISSGAVSAFNTSIASSIKFLASLTVAFGILGKFVGDFDQEMASIAAILGRTTVDSIASLREEAIKLSTEFPVSASKVAEGMRVLAQAGLALNDISRATPDILALSQSTLEDFELSAKLVVKTISSMGLEFDDTTRVVNSLQFAVNKSLNTLETLNNALKFSAPFAKTLGIELEDLLSVLIILSNAGLEAGIAGRNIGQAFNILAKGGQRARDEGLTPLVEELQDVLNTGGTVADMVRILTRELGAFSKGELEVLLRTGELNEEQQAQLDSMGKLVNATDRVNALVSIFGLQGGRVFAQLLGRAGDLDFFRHAMELNVINAADQAGVAMDNLASKTRLAFNRIQAGILSSGFAETTNDSLDELLAGQTLDELGRKLGKLSEVLASQLGPALIKFVDGITLLAEVMAGPLEAATRTTLALFNGVASLLKGPIGQGLLIAATYAFLFQKALGAVGIGLKLIKMAILPASAGIAAFGGATKAASASTAIQVVQMKAQAQMLRAMATQVVLTAKANDLLTDSIRRQAQVMHAHASILAGHANALQRQQGAAVMASGRGGVALNAGVGALFAGTAVMGATRETALESALLAALSGGVTGAAVGSLFPGPGTAIGAGVGAATAGGLALVKAFSSEAEDAIHNTLKPNLKDALTAALEEATKEAVENAAFERIRQGADGSVLTNFELNTAGQYEKFFKFLDKESASAVVSKGSDLDRLVQDFGVANKGSQFSTTFDVGDLTKTLTQHFTELGSTPETIKQDVENFLLNSGIDDQNARAILDMVKQMVAGGDGFTFTLARTENGFDLVAKASEAVPGSVEDFNFRVLSAAHEMEGLRETVKELAPKFAEAQKKLINAQREAANATRAAIQAPVSLEREGSSFLLDNATALGLKGSNVAQAQQKLTSALLFEQASSLIRAKETVRLASLEKNIANAKVTVVQAELTVIQELVQTEIEKIRLLGLGLIAQAVEIDAALALANAQLQAAKALQEQYGFVPVGPSIEELEEKIKTLGASLDAVIANFEVKDGESFYDLVDSGEAMRRFMEKNAGSLVAVDKELEATRKSLQEVVKTMDDTNEELLSLAEVLGLTKSEFSSFDVLGAVRTIKDALVNGRHLSDLIADITSGAEPLGGALGLSAEALIGLGLSATEVQSALDSFAKIQTLNAVQGFLQNFQSLANTVGASASFANDILQVQASLFAVGQTFFDDLLGIADARTLSEIFAKQAFVEQNVNNRISLNLQAEVNIPEGIAPEQRQEIVDIAVSAVSDAFADAAAARQFI